MTCPVCNQPIEVPDGYLIVTCPNCGSDMTQDMVLVV